MWNKKVSYFMIIRVRKGGRGFFIPLALPVLDVTLEALGDLAVAGDFILRRVVRDKKGVWAGKSVLSWFSMAEAVGMVRSAFTELRALGRQRLVDVSCGDIGISVDLR